ncbi:hypothetical protein ACFSKL_15190 [Belliella marina]|uniref:Beta-lactamase-inhibitor-like, PepSY-like n=1 Tax=Belliella marina TaxID=1644146 RepID=A0ABW4VR51_9BACT
MKTLFALLLFGIFSNAFGQEIIRSEIDPSELFPKHTSSFSKPEKDILEASFLKNQTTYEFEIIYNGDVIYRDGIKKQSEGNLSDALNTMSRLDYNINFPYETFDPAHVLEMIESRILEIKKIGEFKYLTTKKFRLVEKNINGDYNIYEMLKDKVEIKLYRIEIQK